MLVVSDTSPIIFFSKIGELNLLKELYSEIFIPFAVWEELIYPLSKPDDDVPSDIKYEIMAKEEGWLIVKDPKSKKYQEMALNLTKELGRGEAYAIALSLDLRADFLLINDKKANMIAESKGIRTKWSTEILLDALDKGLIGDFHEFNEILDQMIETGLWMEKSQYKKTLEKAKNIKK
jgi:hypothetical protein